MFFRRYVEDDDDDPDYSSEDDFRRKKKAAVPTATAPGAHVIENALRFEQVLTGLARKTRADEFAPPPDFDLARVVVRRRQVSPAAR